MIVFLLVLTMYGGAIRTQVIDAPMTCLALATDAVNMHDYASASCIMLNGEREA